MSAAKSRLILAEPLISSPQFPGARSLVRVARTVNSLLTLSQANEKSPFSTFSRGWTPMRLRARMRVVMRRHKSRHPLRGAVMITDRQLVQTVGEYIRGSDHPDL